MFLMIMAMHEIFVTKHLEFQINYLLMFQYKYPILLLIDNLFSILKMHHIFATEH